MAVPAPPPGPIGLGKSMAAVAAGALSTILIYIIDAILKAKGADALPAGIEAAVQTLVTTAAVYFVPHDAFGGS